MANTQLAEERLRSWLDTNQVQQERMCLALLSLDQRFSNIRPRRPKGGPDGARDIEAIYNDEYQTWGAVGFQNSVSDSSSDKRQAKKKFSNDLKSALDQNPSLKSFVFFTNVDFTLSEEDKLIQEAKELGIVFVEIFYRERLRILLDSPEGLGIRFTYLDIPLSNAEQAAFFARFGQQLEDILLKGFDSVDKKLSRIEFLHHCNEPIQHIGFKLSLKKKFPLEELGHFRILVDISDPYVVPSPGLTLSCRDNPVTLNLKEGVFQFPGFDKLAFTSNPNKQLSKGGSLAMSQRIDYINFHLYLKQSFIFSNLGKLNHKWISIFITSPLLNQMQNFNIICNNYTVLSINAENLSFTSHEEIATIFDEPSWKLHITEEEKLIPWVLICPDETTKQDKSNFIPWEIDFDRYTPAKTEEGRNYDFDHEQDEDYTETDIPSLAELGVITAHPT